VATEKVISTLTIFQNLGFPNPVVGYMTQSSASRALLDEPFWFCLKAKPKREHLATLGIRALQPCRKTPPKEITELKDAIRATHGRESLHVESIPVKEVFEDQTAWEGTVQVFDLVGHPQAKRAYAWRHRDGDENKTVVILQVPPVDSPQSAVKVAIAKQSTGQISIDRNGAA
jgi:hypothetical protein